MGGVDYALIVGGLGFDVIGPGRIAARVFPSCLRKASGALNKPLLRQLATALRREHPELSIKAATRAFAFSEDATHVAVAAYKAKGADIVATLADGRTLKREVTVLRGEGGEALFDAIAGKEIQTRGADVQSVFVHLGRTYNREWVEAQGTRAVDHFRTAHGRDLGVIIVTAEGAQVFPPIP
jgi:hypothetical protein